MGKINVDPERISDLDGTHFVKSIQERTGKDSNHDGSPGAPVLQVGGEQQQKKTVIELDNKDEAMGLTKFSHEELIARL